MKINKFLFACGLGLIAMMASCTGNNMTESGLDPAKFDSIVDGKQVKLYTLKNANGMEVCVTNFGARIVSVMAKDKNGIFRDVVLGFDNLNQYINVEGNNFGAAIGLTETVSTKVGLLLPAKITNSHRTTTIIVFTEETMAITQMFLMQRK